MIAFIAAGVVCLRIGLRAHSLNIQTYPQGEQGPLVDQKEAGARRRGLGGEDDGLAACLLVNDENLRLGEWIAYHYQVLPLRHLIVAVDPASETSPAGILSRWNSSDLGMDVTIWGEGDFQPPGRNFTQRNMKNHHDRQNRFVVRCMKEFKQRGQSWVLLIDVDEYIIFNSIQDDDPRVLLRDDAAHLDRGALAGCPPGIPSLRQIRIKGTGITEGLIYGDAEKRNGTKIEIEAVEKGNRTNHLERITVVEAKDGKRYCLDQERALWPRGPTVKEALAARRRLPSVGGGVTIFDVLRWETAPERSGELGACLAMPRLLYGAASVANETNLTQSDAAPEGFDSSKFVTLNSRRHARKGRFEMNKWAKTIIDVSRIPMEAFPEKAFNIHQPLIYYCRRDLPPRYVTSLFRVNHYLDSWQAYSYRNDWRSKRKCRECYDELSSGADVGYDNDICPWLKDFVRSVGHSRASSLLAGTGDFDIGR